MTFWPDAVHLVALLRGSGCVQECLCTDAADAIEGYEATIERLTAENEKLREAFRESMKYQSRAMPCAKHVEPKDLDMCADERCEVHGCMQERFDRWNAVIDAGNSNAVTKYS